MQKTIPDTVIAATNEQKYKICSKCKIEKTPSEFYFDKTRKKIRFRCKECDKQSAKEWRANNKERVHIMDAAWRKKNAEYRKKYELNNKEKRLAKSRKWYSLHSEKRLILSRLWNKLNPNKRKEAYHRRRARKNQNGGNFTWKEFIQLCEKFNNRCLSCKKIGIKLTPDHIVPLAKGGSNSINNIQPLCGPCNSSKQVKIIDYREEKYA